MVRLGPVIEGYYGLDISNAICINKVDYMVIYILIQEVIKQGSEGLFIRNKLVNGIVSDNMCVLGNAMWA